MVRSRPVQSRVVVYSAAEFLFATEVSFRGLDRFVSEQELNLIKFTAGEAGHC